MIPYEFYKVLHICMLFILTSTLGFIFQEHSKKKKILIGIISFMVFVAGMGLIARLGFKHSEPFPLWIKAKILCWVLLNILLIFSVKFKIQAKKIVYLASGILILVAIIMAVYRPGM